MPLSLTPLSSGPLSLWDLQLPWEVLMGLLASCVSHQLEKVQGHNHRYKEKRTCETEQQFGNSTNKNGCICKQPGPSKAAAGAGKYKPSALSLELRSTHMQAEPSRLPSVVWVSSLKPTCLALRSISHSHFYFQCLWAAGWHLSGWLLTFIRL